MYIYEKKLVFNAKSNFFGQIEYADFKNAIRFSLFWIIKKLNEIFTFLFFHYDVPLLV